VGSSPSPRTRSEGPPNRSPGRRREGRWLQGLPNQEGLCWERSAFSASESCEVAYDVLLVHVPVRCLNRKSNEERAFFSSSRVLCSWPRIFLCSRWKWMERALFGNQGLRCSTLHFQSYRTHMCPPTATASDSRCKKWLLHALSTINRPLLQGNETGRDVHSVIFRHPWAFLAPCTPSLPALPPQPQPCRNSTHFECLSRATTSQDTTQGGG